MNENNYSKKGISQVLLSIIIMAFAAIIAAGGYGFSQYRKVAEGPEGQVTSTDKKTTEKTAPISETFSYPYPISWQEKSTGMGNYYIKFDLTKITIGKKIIDNFSSYSSKLIKGDEVNALTFYFKITKVGQTGSGICVRNNLRMELNEEGDLAAPLNPSFNDDCFWDNQTYFDQESIFEVPPSQKKFVIMTGSPANIVFTVTILDDGSIKLEKNSNTE